MAVTDANVIVGFATLWIAPANTAKPTAPTLGAAGLTWGSPWVSPGATEQGVKFSVDRKTNMIRIEEQSTPVQVTTDTTDVQISCSLAEDVIANMQYAYGGGTITTTTPGAGVPGKSELALSDTLSQVAIGFDAINTFGLARRLYIPVAVSAAKVETDYRRAKAARLYPITIQAICPMSSIVIDDYTAPGS